MRFQLSIRTALCLIVISAISVATTVTCYKKHLSYRQEKVQNTPLEWKPFHAERLETILDCEHPVLIFCPPHPFDNINYRYHLEYEYGTTPNRDFRQFVHDHKIELLSFDTEWTIEPDQQHIDAVNSLHEFLSEHQTKLPGLKARQNRWRLRFLLALPGHDRLIALPTNPPYSEDIMAVILSDGKVRSAEEYFNK